MDLPLNALWAFAVSARHLNFAHAANELHLSPTAVSQHVKNLEARYGVRLFHRLPRGLALTDEGRAILPAVAASFDWLAESLQQLRDGRPRETPTTGRGGYLRGGLVAAAPGGVPDGLPACGSAPASCTRPDGRAAAALLPRRRVGPLVHRGWRAGAAPARHGVRQLAGPGRGGCAGRRGGVAAHSAVPAGSGAWPSGPALVVDLQAV